MAVITLWTVKGVAQDTRLVCSQYTVGTSTQVLPMLDESYLTVRTRRKSSEPFTTELDEDHAKCRRRRLLLPDRPCLPPDRRNGAKSVDDVDNSVYLPQYS